jgi:hypothetical protein
MRLYTYITVQLQEYKIGRRAGCASFLGAAERSERPEGRPLAVQDLIGRRNAPRLPNDSPGNLYLTAVARGGARLLIKQRIGPLCCRAFVRAATLRLR